MNGSGLPVGPGGTAEETATFAAGFGAGFPPAAGLGVGLGAWAEVTAGGVAEVPGLPALGVGVALFPGTPELVLGAGGNGVVLPTLPAGC